MHNYKKGQVTLLIIFAIVIVVLVILALVFINRTRISAQQNEAESFLTGCIDSKVKEAVATAELQGGYVKLPEFKTGSADFPFSNYFKFLTLDVPYWFYISGNGIQEQQTPSIETIESQIGDYINQSLPECTRFHRNSSFQVSEGDVQGIDVSIKQNYIDTTVLLPLTVKSGKTETRNTEHKVRTTTMFGTLFSTASDIFNFQNEKTILESYSLDVINNYAPTNGLEISCAPKIWSKSQVEYNLTSALQENIANLKVKGAEYTLKSPQDRYFVINIGKDVTGKVNFLYQKSWPSKIEIWPSSGDILRTDPIGNQQGVGFLGFCFIPYHFVYDLKFPVLVQITSGTELFQFPVVVSIDKMVSRQSILNQTIPETVDLCSTVGQEGTVFTSHDSRPVEADVSFRCLSQTCNLGKTVTQDEKARLTTFFPKCVNGYLILKASGYKETSVLVSTNEPFISDVAMNPTYALPIDMSLAENEYAVISFNSPDYSQTAFYPQQTSISLTEATYTINLQIFKQGEISLGTQQIEKCIKVPMPSVLGLAGMTSEQCYNITTPSTQLTNVLVGGGSTILSLSDSQLQNAKKIKLSSEKLDVPKNLDELASVYDFINVNEIQVSLN
jgi:hypothetical protein